MPFRSNIDNEVNAPNQMRDVILWGCAAIIAATVAISSYVLQADFDFVKSASLAVSNDRSITAETASDGTLKTDDLITGSIHAKNSTKDEPATSFRTTVARGQPNADTIRPMQNKTKSQTAAEQPVLTAKDMELGEGLIGIDLGTGHSFSVLGRRYTALVNAAPTLFADLSPRAAIVEHDSSIEAHLVAGPLKDLKAAQLLCKRIQLRVNTTCQPANFSGRKLNLY